MILDDIIFDAIFDLAEIAGKYYKKIFNNFNNIFYCMGINMLSLFLFKTKNNFVLGLGIVIFVFSYALSIKYTLRWLNK